MRNKKYKLFIDILESPLKFELVKHYKRKDYTLIRHFIYVSKKKEKEKEKGLLSILKLVMRNIENCVSQRG